MDTTCHISTLSLFRFRFVLIKCLHLDSPNLESVSRYLANLVRIPLSVQDPTARSYQPCSVRTCSFACDIDAPECLCALRVLNNSVCTVYCFGCPRNTRHAYRQAPNVNDAVPDLPHRSACRCNGCIEKRPAPSIQRRYVVLTTRASVKRPPFHSVSAKP